MHNSQKITALESDSRLQVIVKTNGRNADNPTLAEVVASGSFCSVLLLCFTSAILSGNGVHIDLVVLHKCDTQW